MIVWILDFCIVNVIVNGSNCLTSKSNYSNFCVCMFVCMCVVYINVYVCVNVFMYVYVCS